jgi:hypothetical protein
LTNPKEDAGHTFGVASLILGILSIVVPNGIIVPIIGLVLGLKSKKRSAATGVAPLGVASGGVVCSIIGLVLGAIITVFVIIYIGVVFIMIQEMMSGSFSGYSYPSYWA